MLTPQEIQEKGFTKAVFGGYDMNEVDAFIETVQADYDALYKENASLKSKIKVLVAKMEQYRASEDSIRTSLANAQKKSEAMYRETREQCRKLTREADEKAKKTVSDMQAKVAFEERRLANAQANADQFVAAIRKIMDKQEEYLKELSKTAEESKAKNAKRQAERKQAKKPLPPLPQPNIDIDFDDSTDTATAEEINDIVSTVMNEKKSAEKPEQNTKKVESEGTRSKKKAKNSDDEFDFKSMKFNK